MSAMPAKNVTELIAVMKAGYLGTVAYGFWRDGAWIEPTLRYTAHDLAGASANDDDPGRIRTGANVAGAARGHQEVPDVVGRAP